MSQDKPVLTVEQIRNWRAFFGRDAVHEVRELREAAAEKMALCDLALSAIERQGWISVEERLPERGTVLAVTADREFDLYHWNLVADYANDPDPSARITHWQPLPPKPQAQDAQTGEGKG